MRGETTIAQAAKAAGVDRSTILRIRTVGKEAAMAALAASKPGVEKDTRDLELEAALAEVARLSEACKRAGREVGVGRGKRGAQLVVSAPVPARVDTATKDTLLGVIDHAIEAGWSLLGACRVLLINPRRVQRWWQWRDTDQLADARPGGTVNQLMPAEVDAISALFDEWGEKDRSHRRLA